MWPRRVRLLPALAMAASMVLVGSIAHAAAGTERFNGVWLIEKSPQALTTVDGKRPPLRPDALAEYEARLAARAKGDLSLDRTTWCAAAGVPRLMLEPHPFEILVNPRQVAFLFEWNR